MRLAVDVSRALGERTGVGRYVEHLLREWARQEIPFDEVHLFAPGPIPEDLVASPRFVPRGRAFRGPFALWQGWELSRNARKLDLLFGPAYTLPPGYRGPAVVSNLGIYEGPHAGGFPLLVARRRSAHYRSSARRARRVIANSESTRRDLASHYGIPVEKIDVVVPGVDQVFRPEPDESKRALIRRGVFGADRRYILFVGKLSPRRHLPELLDAVRTLPGLGLVIVGPNHLGMPVDEWIAARGLSDRVRRREHLDAAELSPLYAAAEAFVLPTTHEGFSFTLLEAMASGLPAVTVEHTALAPDVREAAVVLPAPDPAGLAAAVAALSDPARHAERSAASLRCASGYSWEATSRRTMEILARAAGAS